MSKFTKQEHELCTRQNWRFWVLNNLTNMSTIPVSLQDDPVFKQFFMDAQLTNLREEELMAYYASKDEEWTRNIAGREYNCSTFNCINHI